MVNKAKGKDENAFVYTLYDLWLKLINLLEFPVAIKEHNVDTYLRKEKYTVLIWTR